MTNRLKITTFAKSPYQVELFGQNLIDNYIIEDPRYSLLCREEYQTDDADYIRLTKFIDKIKEVSPATKIIFNLDIIAHNSDLIKLGLLTDFLLEKGVNTVRVMDAGIVNFLLREYSDVNIQLNTETGNNNYLSIRFWKDRLQDRLDRIVLSKELEYKHIVDIINKVSINTEIQAHGNILLLYTKRRVLKELDRFSDYENVIYTEITEGKRPGDNFPLIDNPHGSFLLHPKVICLLEELPRIVDIGVNSILIDLRGYPTDILYDTIKTYYEGINDYYEGKFDYHRLKESLPELPNTSYFKGFFLENDTDKATKKTITYNFKKPDMLNRYVGTVIDTIKDRAITLKLDKSFALGDKLVIDTPEGKLIPLRISELSSIDGESVKNIESGGIYITNWKKGVVKKSNVYFDNSTTG